INNPPRGIGDTTVDRAAMLAAQQGCSLWEIVSHAADYPDLQRAAGKLRLFSDLIRELTDLSRSMELPAFYEEVMARTGYVAMLQGKNDIESRSRLENVRELLTSINSYLENAEGEPSLAGFLDEIALYTDLDNHDPSEEAVVMMTMHAAKGLEFPVVFVVGMEEGIFPGMRAIGETEEMEEERRLCYVALTRAKEHLHLTCAGQRMLFGRTTSNLPSRFTDEIPPELLERSGRSYRSRCFDGDDDYGYARRREDWMDEGFESGKPSYAARQDAYRQPGRTASYGGAYGSFERRTPAPQRPAPAPKPAAPARSAAPAALPQFAKGDMVEHKAFGTGMVLTVQKMGGDALLEIAFDGVGTKKLMLKAAAQHMKKR
ncbi:MAG: 3'-5' exonuclease, partial [Oscillospiraceae bacterium]|nr:3'-5' exonuclease [Oscillospiraceae bacterium]